MAGNDRTAQEEECERFRWAAEDALQQLDWCIGYLHGIRKHGQARALAHTSTLPSASAVARTARCALSGLAFTTWAVCHTGSADSCSAATGVMSL